MRTVGLATIFLLIALALSSFSPFPVPLSIVMPHNTPNPSRPSPKPYTVPWEYSRTLVQYCDETGVPVWLAARLFEWESGWNHGYRSRVNLNGTRDYGLAALNSAYLVHFQDYNDGRTVDPFDPEPAMRVGVRYLADLFTSTGSWRDAVSAYNTGLAAWLDGKRAERHIKEVMDE